MELENQETVVPADFSDRLVAFYIDLFILLIFMGLIGIGISRLETPFIKLIYGISVILSFFLYHGILNVYPGQTPGKWIAGIKVLSLNGNQTEKLGWLRSFLRSLAYILSGAPLFLGYFWCLFNDTHRTWHDFLCGTCVVRARPKTRLAQWMLRIAAFLISLGILFKMIQNISNLH